jgi:hypothetical protein
MVKIIAGIFGAFCILGGIVGYCACKATGDLDRCAAKPDKQWARKKELLK